MNKKRKKRAITLIEIMIVIVLIGLIGGALAYNMRGSLDKGKIFKTEQNIARVYDILMLEYALGNQDLAQIAEDPQKVIDASLLLSDKSKGEILKDAWGQPLVIQADNEDLKITSSKLQAVKQKYQLS